MAKRTRTADDPETPSVATPAVGSSRFAPIRVSVGGTLFTTTRATLCAEKGSMLAAKFAEDSPFGDLITDDTGAIFLDSDPATFTWILGYLRRGCVLAGTPVQPLLEQVRADADYFGLAGLVAALDKQLESTTQEPKYGYDHTLVGPMTFDKETAEGQKKRKEYVQSIEDLCQYGARGFRVAHAAVDAEGQYVDCILEKRL